MARQFWETRAEGTTADDPESKLRYTAFERGLQQLGWTQGQNLQ
jgi:hypothetical protein